MNGMGGLFYQVAQPDLLIVDLGMEPTNHTQSDLRSEIGDFEDLMVLDFNYCSHVEGVSQESKLWVARNQNRTGLQDADLQRFKNVAWNECVIKKFLSTKEGDAELVGKSMMSIIQALNLQWESLQVMGLHPKIEAAEKQVVMSCMEKGFIPYELDVGKIARSFRRCEHFCDFFANAVGAQIVANTGRTPGLSKTMYGTDLDYAYKDKALFYFESALQRFKHMVQKCISNSDNADYIDRLSQLKVVKKPSRVQLTTEPTSEPVIQSTMPYPVVQQPAPRQEARNPEDTRKIARMEEILQIISADMIQVKNDLQEVTTVLASRHHEPIERIPESRAPAPEHRPVEPIPTALLEDITHIRAVVDDIRRAQLDDDDPMDDEAIYDGAPLPPVEVVPVRGGRRPVKIPVPKEPDDEGPGLPPDRA